MNWFSILKNQGLVNLPKFKIKPFDKPKPDEDDTRCKDKIMEIFDFVRRYQFPREIGGEFVRVKKESNPFHRIEDSSYTTMHYGGKKTRTGVAIDRFYAVGDIDNIPEEVFCAALDLLKAGGGRTTLMDYDIKIELRDNEEFYMNQLIISKPMSRDILNLRLSLLWSDWFNWNITLVQTDSSLSSEEENKISQALKQETNNMRWPI